MGEHRWSGYSHEELYQKLHSGLGPKASYTSMERWAGVSTALAEINADLHAGVQKSGAAWEGTAADRARAGLTPLAQWADDARAGAELMRISAELQADYISKARLDMPKPVEVTAEKPGTLIAGLTHLLGGQTDYEKQEKTQNAAEEQAREVMATYASSTTANTSTLGQFQQPPQLTITTSPTGRAEGPGAVAAGPVFGFTPQGAGAPSRGPAGRSFSRSGGTNVAAPRGAAPPGGRPAPSTGGSASTTASSAPSPTKTVAAPGTPASPATAPGGSVGGAAPVPGQERKREARATDSTVASSAGPATSPVTSPVAGPMVGPVVGTDTIGATSDTVYRKTPIQPASTGFDPFGTLGGRAQEEEDAVHESADYLRETDEIYGIGGMISPPVIGESSTH